MVNNKPVKKTTTKKVVKPKVNTLKSKLSDFLKNGKDWSYKHYNVSDRIKVQILPESKSNPRRLGLFLTNQGRGGRSGLRISNKSTYNGFVADLIDDKTIEIIDIIDSLNPESESESESDDL